MKRQAKVRGKMVKKMGVSRTCVTNSMTYTTTFLRTVVNHLGMLILRSRWEAQ